MVWYQDCEESGIFDRWETPVQALLLLFGTTSHDDPIEALTRLRLSNRIRGLSPQHKLSCFLSGPKDEVRLPVQMLNPPTLNEAFGLAKIQEVFLIGCEKITKVWHDSGKSSILGMPPKVSGFIEEKTRIPIKRISATQMEERKKKGLCHNCDEKWVLGHRCKNAKLFLKVLR